MLVNDLMTLSSRIIQYASPPSAPSCEEPNVDASDIRAILTLCPNHILKTEVEREHQNEYWMLFSGFSPGVYLWAAPGFQIPFG